jgi:hypothetical protein
MTTAVSGRAWNTVLLNGARGPSSSPVPAWAGWPALPLLIAVPLTAPPHFPPRARSDPNPFFQALLKRPFRRAVVISPSVYDTRAPAPNIDPSDPGAPPQAPAWPAGPSPIKIMDTTFAYLAKGGYCVGQDCQRFPVAVGEFSSRLAGGPELDALNEFAARLRAADVAYDGVGTWRFWGFEDGGGGDGVATAAS